MIQVCSRCSTRWNVRDRQRQWCPRCRGPLLAPDAPTPAGQTKSSRGYRWIAVRPGPAPKPRRHQPPLGPTPHYDHIPRWGLTEEFTQAPELAAEQEQAHRGPSTAVVQTVAAITMIALGAAALMHVVRYVLLLINRTVLLNPWVALAGSWLGVAASVVALFAVLATAIVFTNWLIARRAAAYHRAGTTEPRRRWVLWVGCLVPVVNMFLAPVFVTEMATAENRVKTLRRPIGVWWAIWAVSGLVVVWSIVGMFATDPQGIADSTEVTVIAYLMGMLSLALVLRVYHAFERTQADAPAQRWVVLDADQAEESGAQSAVPVEPTPEEPAA
ncbi:membrane protein [Mycolicibacterium mucogenicum DSM 44124]|uniref:DUF4328 domain-containing protein n=1 Tax=Mycolicibacterium mucogenicum DSM 44124 TaxID=1226753 RepID=A0A8H2PK70_MYCMU|nr:membrane protein [Mycolicibacterium mucogenicum DSM 44124]QPG69210.1 DUF4328 domain-containing protein [Mycolicibacterium mucogenicum DSM 44124]